MTEIETQIRARLTLMGLPQTILRVISSEDGYFAGTVGSEDESPAAYPEEPDIRR